MFRNPIIKFLGIPLCICGSIPVHIAGRSLRPIRLRIEDVNAMRLLSSFGVVESQAEFERHVEAGNAMGQLDAGKIVNRKIRTFDK